MKGINDVVLCESKRLDDPAEFNKRAQTVKLLLYAFKCPIQIDISKPQQCYSSNRP